MKFKDMIIKHNKMKSDILELNSQLNKTDSDLVKTVLETQVKSLEREVKEFEETSYVTEKECNSRIDNAKAWAND